MYVTTSPFSSIVPSRLYTSMKFLFSHFSIVFTSLNLCGFAFGESGSISFAVKKFLPALFRSSPWQDTHETSLPFLPMCFEVKISSPLFRLKPLKVRSWTLASFARVFRYSSTTAAEEMPKSVTSVSMIFSFFSFLSVYNESIKG